MACRICTDTTWCPSCAALAARAGVVLAPSVPYNTRSGVQDALAVARLAGLAPCAPASVPSGATHSVAEGHKPDSVLAVAGTAVLVVLTLPYPPSSNHLYATRADNRRHLSQSGRAFHRQVQQVVLSTGARMANDERARARWCPWPMTGRLIASLYVYPPDRRRRDIENVSKIVWDALKGVGLYQDDSQIDELHIYRGAVREVACVEVRIAVANAVA